MKSVVRASVAVALAASAVSAQGGPQFPDCAYDCLSHLNAIAGCVVRQNTLDAGCFCNSNAFLRGFAPCIGASCEPRDYQGVSDSAEALCLGAGRVVTVTVEAPASTPVPAALARFPDCARDCVNQLNLIAGCRSDDYRCFCASNAFLAGFNPCITVSCPPSDYDATSNAAEALCADNGVTVTVTATFTPPPRPTNIPTSAPAETEPAETTGPEETEPAETTGPEETEPAETTGPEETEPAETTGPAETTAPAPTGGDQTTTVTRPANGTSSGSGSTPTTNGGARQTAFAGVLGAAFVVGAALL